MQAPAKETLGREYRKSRDHVGKLLESLSPEEWGRPSLCAGWSVKDVALHLLIEEEQMWPSLFSQLAEGRASPFGGFDLSTDPCKRAGIMARMNALTVEAHLALRPDEIVARFDAASKQTQESVERMDAEQLGAPVWIPLSGIVPFYLAFRFILSEHFVHMIDIQKPLKRGDEYSRELVGPVIEFTFLISPYVLPKERIQSFRTRFGFDFHEGGGGKWLLTVAGGTVTVESGTIENADVILRGDPLDIYLAVVTGKKNLWVALLQRKVRVRGGLRALFRLRSLISPMGQ